MSKTKCSHTHRRRCGASDERCAQSHWSCSRRASPSRRWPGALYYVYDDDGDDDDDDGDDDGNDDVMMVWW